MSLAVPPVPPTAAASVVLLRPGPAGLELLFLKRNPELRFHGGYWVFPGGRIDPSDHPEGGTQDETVAAKRAAVREAKEEAGVDVAVDTLAFAVHWTTPRASPIRFSTWFFAAEAPSGNVEIDGQEIHDHCWLRPRDALDSQQHGGMKLAAPTFAITTRLAPYPSVDEALSAVASWPEERLIGRSHEVPGGRVALYEQDVAYESGRLDQAGPRHRLWMVDGDWRYEREF